MAENLGRWAISCATSRPCSVLSFTPWCLPSTIFPRLRSLPRSTWRHQFGVSSGTLPASSA